MPLYEYKCPKCNSRKEVLQRFDAAAPDCCGSPMARQISRTNFSLKGGGWYKDHYGLKPTTPSDSQD